MHAAGELPWGSQPPAPTCVVCSWRLKGCFAPASAVKGRLHRTFSPISARRLCHADEQKQLYMAATARVIWLCACVGTGQTLGWCSSASLAFIVVTSISQPASQTQPMASYLFVCDSGSEYYLGKSNDRCEITETQKWITHGNGSFSKSLFYAE